MHVLGWVWGASHRQRHSIPKTLEADSPETPPSESERTCCGHTCGDDPSWHTPEAENAHVASLRSEPTPGLPVLSPRQPQPPGR